MITSDAGYQPTTDLQHWDEISGPLDRSNGNLLDDKLRSVAINNFHKFPNQTTCCTTDYSLPNLGITSSRDNYSVAAACCPGENNQSQCCFSPGCTTGMFGNPYYAMQGMNAPGYGGFGLPFMGGMGFGYTPLMMGFNGGFGGGMGLGRLLSSIGYAIDQRRMMQRGGYNFDPQQWNFTNDRQQSNRLTDRQRLQENDDPDPGVLTLDDEPITIVEPNTNNDYVEQNKNNDNAQIHDANVQRFLDLINDYRASHTDTYGRPLTKLEYDPELAKQATNNAVKMVEQQRSGHFEPVSGYEIAYFGPTSAEEALEGFKEGGNGPHNDIMLTQGLTKIGIAFVNGNSWNIDFS